MKRALLLSGVAIGLAGCAGQNGGSSFGSSYDSSLNPPGTPYSTGPAPIPNVAAWPSENGKQSLVFGVGAPTLEKLVLAKDDLSKNAEVPDALKQISDMGFNVVRLSLFNSTDGLKMNKDGTVNGLGDSVEKNLGTLANLAADKGLKLYLGGPDTFAGYDKNPILDTKARDAYFSNAIAAVARKLKGSKGVFALRLSGPLLPAAATDTQKAIDWNAVRDFIKAGSESVKRQDPDRLVTVGPYPADKIAEAQLTSSGLDFFDVVTTDANLVQTKMLNLNRPVLLGRLPTDKAVDVKMVALKSVEAGYAGFIFPTYGWKGTEQADALIGKDGKATTVADSLTAVIKELKPGSILTSPATTPPGAR